MVLNCKMHAIKKKKKKKITTILSDTLIIRLIKQQSIWQTHFCWKRCARSKFQVHCLLLGGRQRWKGEGGRGWCFLLPGTNTTPKNTRPNRSDFNWCTWMRKGKINNVKSAGEDSGRHPWTQKANRFHKAVFRELFSNTRRWLLDLTFYVTQIMLPRYHETVTNISLSA